MFRICSTHPGKLMTNSTKTLSHFLFACDCKHSVKEKWATLYFKSMSSLPLAESRLWDKYTQIILLHSQGSTLDLAPAPRAAGIKNPGKAFGFFFPSPIMQHQWFREQSSHNLLSPLRPQYFIYSRVNIAQKQIIGNLNSTKGRIIL